MNTPTLERKAGMSKKKKRGQSRNVDPYMHADSDGNPILSPNGYSYLFCPKHHKGAREGDACWHKRITRDIEFRMFHEADGNNLTDDKGNYYNVCREENSCIEIGTRHENVAKFWKPNSNRESHGFPVWPILTRRDRGRRAQDDIPPLSALQKMVDKRVISTKEKFLLLKGRNI